VSEADCNVVPAHRNVVNVQGPPGDKGQLGAMGPLGREVRVSFVYTFVDRKLNALHWKPKRIIYALFYFLNTGP
jgi:hypothetical protein